MNDIAIRAERLVKNYVTPGETLKILQGLDFEIEKSASAAICGQSGCGKSTLLNILGGLDTADSGKVIAAGQDISKLGEPALSEYRKKNVGFIFQFHYLLKDFTALENVMLPAFMTGIKKRAALERARGLLAELKLIERANHLPAELSGGERQRVAVARALINDPEIILADEPTGNLDPEHTGVVADLLFGIARKFGKTLIVVTHDARVASRASRRFTLAFGALTPAEG
ncbi:MAG: ABC transporter ATP-binding protein [Spirochaetaceae bacterium]|nr:ABC transporter ATP-binding protein [Spirochaetaceae bacterium]